MRANLTLAWDRGDWSAYYQYEYIASMYESSSFDVATLTSSAQVTDSPRNPKHSSFL